MFELGIASVDKVAKQFRTVWRIVFGDGSVRYAGASRYSNGTLFTN
jgi:hypothetical protein